MCAAMLVTFVAQAALRNPGSLGFQYLPPVFYPRYCVSISEQAATTVALVAFTSGEALTVRLATCS